jgi:hypothetical protein
MNPFLMLRTLPAALVMFLMTAVCGFPQNQSEKLPSASPEDARTERGLPTPLHNAAASGNVAALAALLESSTNLEAKNELGLTPLQVAVLNGHLASASLLVDKGANINASDPDGNTLLHQIFKNHYFIQDRPTAQWLARLKDRPHKNDYVTNLTVAPGMSGPQPIVQGVSFLLACGADTRATNHAGETVMQWMTEKKNVYIRLLFDEERTLLFNLLKNAAGPQNAPDAKAALHQKPPAHWDI